MAMVETLTEAREHILKALLTPPGADDPLRVLREAYLNAAAYQASGGERGDVTANDQIKGMVNGLLQLRLIAVRFPEHPEFVAADMKRITEGDLCWYKLFSFSVACSQNEGIKDAKDRIAAHRGVSEESLTRTTSEEVLATSGPLIALIDAQIKEMGLAASAEQTARGFVNRTAHRTRQATDRDV